MRVSWSGQARNDLLAADAYLSAINPRAAQILFQAMVLAADSLVSLPNRDRAGQTPGTREIVVIRPYILVYRVVGDEVVFLRIWHAAQSRR